MLKIADNHLCYVFKEKKDPLAYPIFYAFEVEHSLKWVSVNSNRGVSLFECTKMEVKTSALLCTYNIKKIIKTEKR